MVARPLSFVPVLLSVSLSMGCYTTKPSITQTGEPLSVVVKTNSTRTEYRGKMIDPGTVEYLAALKQGDRVVEDELDFYAAAGDQKKVDEIVKWREQSNFASLASWGGFAVAAALTAGALGWFAYRTDGFNENAVEPYFTSTEGQINLAAVTAGAALVGITPFAYSFLGPSQQLIFEAEPGFAGFYELLYPREVAAEVAATYNASLATPAEPAAEPAAEAPAAP